MSKSVRNQTAHKIAVTNKKTAKPKQTRAPAKTIESRENQLVSLATSLAESQLRNGTASSQVITHYLKLGTTNALLEKERLVRENELLKAKAEALSSHKKVEELYGKAILAMRSYSGLTSVESDEDEENDS